MGTLVRLWIVFSQASLGCRNWAPTSGTKVTSFLRISCKSGPATAETHRGPWAHLRKGCKNPDWFTSVLPGLPQSSAASPVPLFHCGCFRDPQRAGLRECKRCRVGEKREREREGRGPNRRAGKRKKERKESERVNGWGVGGGEVTGHRGRAGHSQSALCKQASSWSGQVGGGVSPPRATEAVSRADNWWQECGICS